MRAKRFQARQFVLDTLSTDSDECILWPYYITPKGYGDVNFPGIKGLVHNVMCKLAHGDPEEGQEASHSCGKRSCINPNHLSWKLHDLNIKDKELQGKQPKGEEIHFSVLTEEDVRYIRNSKMSQRSLAKLFGVCPATISCVRTYKTWKHI